MSEDIKNEGLEPSLSSDQDILSMSDEDILNMSFPEPEAEEAAIAADDEPEGEGMEDELQDTEEESDEEFPEEEEDEDPFGDDDTDTEEDADPFQSDETDEAEEEATEEVSEVDFKAKYEELMAPFKGNGKEIKVDSPEDLRRLAQMGVGYNARMAELKPIRKIAKMLENEGLLDESKINFLIDLSKNNPDAINKLVRDSGINPLDIDTEGTDGYKPNTYTVNDTQLALDEALDELERTPSGQRVIDVVSNKWDKNSKQVLVSNPAHMRQLEQHINDGIFDKVTAAVERERLFNRLPAGVSDLEAYNIIGQQMAARGEFNAPATAQQEAPVTKPAQDTKRKSRKRAAAPSKGGKRTTSKSSQANLLSMSDEEFEKTLMSKYM
ncbi:tail length tape measure protein [Pseudoalteromonas phage pYD6-A]|uniref:Tape measure protein n=1 Tax=Pseudoalteromonas phage pYD6-A TaxID=754052 RepID=M4SQN2_9CAUD|nr:tail length tape measure protein [Pseudoalteromonas phage pYD6-A]AGH57615.1 hypothetical protein PYDG_00086 [Pseudoalteromonas phage pYD6-A]